MVSLKAELAGYAAKVELRLAALIPDADPETVLISEAMRYAVLGRDGVQVWFPAGRFIPAALGSRKLTLRYSQVAECMEGVHMMRAS